MPRTQDGFTYLALLFAVAMAGVVLATLGVIWSMDRQREREQQLLFIGHQFRQAIHDYYENSPGLVKRYPRDLNDLLKDNRYLGVRRYLRQIYIDPMTGNMEWGLVAAPEGGVMGVYSLSNVRPIKQARFRDSDVDLAAKAKYSEWKFVYRPLVASRRVGQD